MFRYDVIETSWGVFVAVVGTRGLVMTSLPDRSAASAERSVLRRWPDAKLRKNAMPGLRRAVSALFGGKRVVFDFPVDLSGVTEFRRLVMEAARRIPYGSLASYSDVARAVGSPLASRAVGTTMANNPLPLIVPCHRVVRSDGTMGGFSSPDGVAMKRRLLALEGVADIPRMASR